MEEISHLKLLAMLRILFKFHIALAQNVTDHDMLVIMLSKNAGNSYESPLAVQRWTYNIGLFDL